MAVQKELLRHAGHSDDDEPVHAGRVAREARSCPPSRKNAL